MSTYSFLLQANILLGNKMKTLITTLSLITLLAGTLSSEAMSTEYTGFTSDLTAIHTATDFPYIANFPFTNGNVQINLESQYVILNLNGPSSKCPEGAQCFIPTYNVFITLRLVDIEKSYCGDRYIARTEFNGRAGGTVETVIITDYSRALCKMVFPASTVIDYYYQNGRPERLGKSQFYGTQLKPYIGMKKY